MIVGRFSVMTDFLSSCWILGTMSMLEQDPSTSYGQTFPGSDNTTAGELKWARRHGVCATICCC
jgi:hypothetical protein